MRHGTAAPGADDGARPLTPGGRAEVEATAQALRSRGAAVARIHHSGLVRARETAEILGRVLVPAGGIHAIAGLLPEDAPDVLRAELDVATEPVLLVGHLPHLARLAAALVGAAGMERVSLAPATALGLRRGSDGWELELVVPARAGGPS